MKEDNDLLDEYNERNKKPPLGVIPEDIWLEQRAIAVAEAIIRYLKDSTPVPIKWTEELNDLVLDLDCKRRPQDSSITYDFPFSIK